MASCCLVTGEPAFYITLDSRLLRNIGTHVAYKNRINPHSDDIPSMSHSYCLQKTSNYKKQEENKKGERERERTLIKKSRIQEVILHRDIASLGLFRASYGERHVSFLLWVRSVLEFNIYSIKAYYTIPFHFAYLSCLLLLWNIPQNTLRHTVSKNTLQNDALYNDSLKEVKVKIPPL